MNDNKKKLWAVIYSNLSENSLARLQQEAIEWSETYDREDPLSLWKLILKTHLVSSTADIDPEDARDELEQEYRSKTVQRPGESLIAFKERFETVVKKYTSLDMQPPTQAAQACKFIKCLEKARFGALQAQVANLRTCKLSSGPQTLLEAFNLAANYKVVTVNNTVVSAAVFVTSERAGGKGIKSSKGGKGKAKDGKGDDRPGASDNKNTGGDKQKKLECFLCGKPGHKMSKCPQLDTCKEVAKQNEEGVHLAKQLTFPIVQTELEDSLSVLTATTGADSRYMVMLDNEASTSIFNNKDLLSNVRATDDYITIGGINASAHTHISESIIRATLHSSKTGATSRYTGVTKPELTRYPGANSGTQGTLIWGITRTRTIFTP
jgi:hypothetical protein